MGYLGCLFSWLHPIRHTGRQIRRAVTPRPIRRLLRAKNQVLHPVSSAERSVFRVVDRAVTPKRKRQRRRRVLPAPDAAFRQVKRAQPDVTHQPQEPAARWWTPEPARRTSSDLFQGFAAFSVNDLENAERNLRAVVEATPRSEIAHNNLGFVLLAEGQVEQALAAFKRAEKMGADCLEQIEANMACCHYLLGNATASSALFENCMNARSFVAAGILYGISGDHLFLASVPLAAAYTQLMALNAAWSALRAGKPEIARTRAAMATGLLGLASDQALTDSLEELNKLLK